MLDKLSDDIIAFAEKIHNVLAGAMKNSYDRGETITRESRFYQAIEGVFLLVVAAIAAVIFVVHTILVCALGWTARMLDD